jgi:hypothetical protein
MPNLSFLHMWITSGLEVQCRGEYPFSGSDSEDMRQCECENEMRLLESVLHVRQVRKDTLIWLLPKHQSCHVEPRKAFAISLIS